MAIPIFLDSKLAFVSGQEGKVRFQTIDSSSIVYYRLKSASTGQLLSVNKHSFQSTTLEPGSGVENIYSFPVTWTSDDFNGAITANLSVSLNKQTWSPSIQVSLISQPEMTIKTEQDLRKAEFHIYGTLAFSSTQETDFLDTYKITIKKKQNGEIQEVSTWLKPVVQNAFDYTVKMVPEENVEYIILVEYITSKGYATTQSGNYYFVNIPTASPENADVKFCDIKGAVNQIQDGIVRIEAWGIQGSLDDSRAVTVYLDRTSSHSAYSKWETIQTYPMRNYEQNTQIEIALKAYDKYLDYGMGYKYRLRALFKNSQGTVYQIKTEPTEVFSMRKDDILLEAADLSYLTVRFNPTISSYKYNRKEAVTATIGGVYPIVRRSGNQQYRSFTIGGLISSEGEDKSNNTLLPSSDMVNHVAAGYQKDVLIERLFREKVLEFLFRDEVFLYRSEIEGMMLVKLTNISLTPETKLGRRLWSFTAQATEIDECTSESLQKYNFQIPLAPSAQVVAYGDLVIVSATDVDNGTLTVTSVEGSNDPYSLVAVLKWFDPDTDQLLMEEE